jgi:hypothetical protein
LVNNRHLALAAGHLHCRQWATKVRRKIHALSVVSSLSQHSELTAAFAAIAVILCQQMMCVTAADCLPHLSGQVYLY